MSRRPTISARSVRDTRLIVPATAHSHVCPPIQFAVVNQFDNLNLNCRVVRYYLTFGVKLKNMTKSDSARTRNWPRYSGGEPFLGFLPLPRELPPTAPSVCFFHPLPYHTPPILNLGDLFASADVSLIQDNDRLLCLHNRLQAMHLIENRIKDSLRESRALQLSNSIFSCALFKKSIVVLYHV